MEKEDSPHIPFCVPMMYEPSMPPAAGPSRRSDLVRAAGLHLLRASSRVHMAIAAYYDGSGKTDCSAMTLSGVVASESAWNLFEPAWEAALDAHQVPERMFSMADLMAGRKNFSSWRGQSPRKRALLTDLFNVFGQVRQHRMALYSCTIFLHAHRSAKLRIPGLRKPEAICVDFCAGGLQLSEEELSAEPRPILLYFDRGEGYLHTINRVWLRKRNQGFGWPSQVRNVLPVDSSYYAIQAADMIAWIVNRSRTHAKQQGFPEPQDGLRSDGRVIDLYTLYLMGFLTLPHYMRCYSEPEHITVRYQSG